MNEFAPDSTGQAPRHPSTRTPFPAQEGGRSAPRRRRMRPLVAIAAGALLLVLMSGGAAWWGMQTRPAANLPAIGTPAPLVPAGLVVRGVVRPAAWSRIGTQLGGVVTTLAAPVGDTVTEGQVLARVRSPLDGSIEVISAPWAGTVTARGVSLGDSVMPGATLFVVSDLSSLRIEVADVDEFTVSRVHRGQRAVVAVPALDVQGASAIVRSVGAQPVGASVPDASLASTTDHYPVSVDLMEPVPGLRIGMAVRLRLEE